MLDIAVADSWNGENIGAQLRKAGEKVGHNPLYVITFKYLPCAIHNA
jgi:hypothetical protein